MPWPVDYVTCCQRRFPTTASKPVYSNHVFKFLAIPQLLLQLYDTAMLLLIPAAANTLRHTSDITASSARILFGPTSWLPMCDYIQSTYTTGEVLKRNVDRRMMIGSDIVKHDDATSTPSSI